MPKSTRQTSFRTLRHQYAVSVARANLEITEAGEDSDAVHAAVQRQDDRDRKICDAVHAAAPPTDFDELDDLLEIAVMWLDEYYPDMQDSDLRKMIVKAIDADLELISRKPATLREVRA